LENSYNESIRLIKDLGCRDKYFFKDNAYWFGIDPSFIFVVKADGKIIIQNLYTDKVISIGSILISIGSILGVFSKIQRKSIVFNLDKFE